MKKKKLKRIIINVLLMGIIVFETTTTQQIEVKASEVIPSIENTETTNNNVTVAETATVTLKANTDGYTDDIAIQLIDGNNKAYSIILNSKNNYTDSLIVAKNNIFNIQYTLRNGSYFSVDGLDNSYTITGDTNIVFNVKKILEESNADQIINQEEQQVATNNMINDVKQEAIQKYQDYLEKVNFIDGNSDYDAFLDVYSGTMFKNYFLDADSMNSEAQWDSMSKYERFNYYILYVQPETIITKAEVSQKSDFMKRLNSAKNMLETIPDGKNVSDALVDIWEWQWGKYEETGNVINFFEYFPKSKVEENELLAQQGKDDSIDTEEIAHGEDENTKNEGVDNLKNIIVKYRYEILLTMIAVIGLFVLWYRKKREEEAKELLLVDENDIDVFDDSEDGNDSESNKKDE